MIEKLVIEKEVVLIKEKIKKDQLPLFLWGMGSHARQIVQFCKTYGITLAGAFAEGICFEKKWMDIPVFSLDEIKKQNPRFSVIVGHAAYYKAEAFKKEHNVENIYCVTSVSCGLYDRILSEFIEENDEKYSRTYEWLCDEESKKNMEAYLNARMNDNPDYTMKRYQAGTTYFKNDVIEIGENESYIDVGAYDGDTIKEFIRSCDNKYNKILGLEADKQNFLRLDEYIKENKLKRVKIADIGAWCCKTELHFNDGNEQRSGINMETTPSGNVIHVDTIDHICELFEFDQVSLMKFNYYEGVVEALQGCSEIIKKSKPKFAIKVGFDEWELIQIPQKLKELCPEYQLFLRYCLPIPAGLTLFAI